MKRQLKLPLDSNELPVTMIRVFTVPTIMILSCYDELNGVDYIDYFRDKLINDRRLVITKYLVFHHPLRLYIYIYIYLIGKMYSIYFYE